MSFISIPEGFKICHDYSLNSKSDLNKIISPEMNLYYSIVDMENSFNNLLIICKMVKFLKINVYDPNSVKEVIDAKDIYVKSSINMYERFNDLKNCIIYGMNVDKNIIKDLIPMLETIADRDNLTCIKENINIIR